MQVLATEKKPIKMWLEELEDGALEQAKHLANLPFTFKHIALMPDCHQGYGMPIGGVLATTDVVVPNAVGVDIGCGMCAIKTSIQRDITKEELEKICELIRKVVPVGFAHHKENLNDKFMPCLPYDKDTYNVIFEEYTNALFQLGTLGGGNHFIELQKDEEGFVWIMVHSGSRNLGYKVAKYYNELAVRLNKQYYTSVPKEWDLAFLPLNTPVASYYLAEMQYCVDFALANRQVIIEKVSECIKEVMGETIFSNFLNIAHNYAAIEKHYGKEVMVHRKGATRAFKGELGIIPGSQGTTSYIVEGKGNRESFKSCSHGAGRKMGRKEAQHTLNLEEQKKVLDGAGVVHSIKTEKDLDEAPGAYKDINQVMKNQNNLVEIKIKLKPIAVVKG